MMKAAPPSSLEVVKSEFSLELFVVPLDSPSTLVEAHERLQRRVRGKRGQRILGQFGFPRRPLDQEPFLLAGNLAAGVAMSRPNAHGGKSRAKGVCGAFAPGDAAKSRARKAHREFANGDRFMPESSPEKSRSSAAPGIALRRKRPLPLRPNRRRRLDSDHVVKAARRHLIAKLRDVAVARIGDNHPGANAAGQSAPDMIESDLGFRLEDDFFGNVSFLAPDRIVGPSLRKVEAVTDRKAGELVRN
jgi:hypothetical protein